MEAVGIVALVQTGPASAAAQAQVLGLQLSPRLVQLTPLQSAFVQEPPSAGPVVQVQELGLQVSPRLVQAIPPQFVFVQEPPSLPPATHRQT